MQNLCIMVVKYLYVFFFNAPKKLLNHKIHKDVNFHFLCLFLMCSRKSSRIRSIFHTGDSSAPPRILCKICTDLERGGGEGGAVGP